VEQVNESGRFFTSSQLTSYFINYRRSEVERAMKRHPILSSAILAALAFVVLSSASAQSSAPQTVSPDDPKFSAFVYDVVSIKPYQDPPNATSSSVYSKDLPDGFSMHNSPLTVIIGQAYRTEHSKIAGAPDWLNRERFDIEAKMDPEVADALQKLSAADQKLARQHMLRVLARDYLKLAFHMETSEVPIYNLVVGKNGAKLKPPADPNTPGGVRMSGAGSAAIMDGKNTTLRSILGTLSLTLGRPVYDMTGLTGNFDFTVKFTPERPGTASPSVDSNPLPEEAPTITIAIEEQLGLKLVSGKGPMDVIVIDHLERPAVN
jgi:bla regulator protein blaR1